jgi:hypothetical protein
VVGAFCSKTNFESPSEAIPEHVVMSIGFKNVKMVSFCRKPCVAPLNINIMDKGKKLIYRMFLESPVCFFFQHVFTNNPESENLLMSPPPGD